MAKATKTVSQVIEYRPGPMPWLGATRTLYNAIARFYFDLIAAEPAVLVLDNHAALTELEKRTHRTRRNPTPTTPLDALAPQVPAMFRRAAIRAAIGSARSFFSNLENWKARKAKREANGRRFTERPPVPPRAWNRSVVFYSGMYKDRTDERITLKLWTGASWSWVRFQLHGRSVPEGYQTECPQAVERGGRWRLHTPTTHKFPSPGGAAEQFANNPRLRVCAVDLNINDALAVCAITDADGTAVASRFVRGGDDLHDRRKRRLGQVARNRRRTGILEEDIQDNADLWRKINAIDEDTAHRLSCRIVDFAAEHGAAVIVFEHLGNYRPIKGRYSKRGNDKRSYWLRGRVYRYSHYKAWAAGIVVRRVSPRNTSRECHRCGGAVARYDRFLDPFGPSYTPGAPLVACLDAGCGMRGDADLNAARVIAKRLFVRLAEEIAEERQRQQEKKGEASQHRPSPVPAKAERIQATQEASNGPSADGSVGAGRRHGGEDWHGVARPVSPSTRQDTSPISVSPW